VTAQQAAVRREEEEAVEQAAPESVPTQAEARGRASSVPTALPTAQPADTDSDSPGRPELVRAWLLMRASAVKDRPLDLIHGPPATIGALHARHAQAAAHWKSPVPRSLRTAWGWLHTAVYAQLLVLADAMFSPAGAVLAVLFILACWHWL
jgi:hypothetical protein